MPPETGKRSSTTPSRLTPQPPPRSLSAASSVSQKQGQQPLLSPSNNPDAQAPGSSEPDSGTDADSAPATPEPPSLVQRLGSHYASLASDAFNAVQISWVTEVELLSSFRWEAAADIQTALLYALPLLAMNAALLLPEYSQGQGSASSTDPAPTTLQERASGGADPDGSAPGAVAGAVAGAGLQPPADPRLTFAQGMRLAQTNYVVSSSKLNFPPAVEAATAVVQSVVLELLNTGVYFVLPARWLTDRLLESGSGEAFLLPLPILGTEQGLTLTAVQGGQWITAAVFALPVATGVSQAALARFTTLNLNALTEVQATLEVLSSEPIFRTLGAELRKLQATDGRLNSRWLAPLVDQAAEALRKLESREEALKHRATKPILEQFAATRKEMEAKATPPPVPPGASAAAQRLAAAVTRTQVVTRQLTVHSVYILTGGNLAATAVLSTVHELSLVLLKQGPLRRLAQETQQRELMSSSNVEEAS
ncbi:MAG: hypothetical protein WDW38_000468 [Sanguina aurantia]